MTRDEIITEVSKNDSTVLSFPNRGPWGSSKYRGNCSGWIQAFLIWKYQVKKMAELFAGSGTGSDVCRDMDIDYIGADLNPNPVRSNILSIDAITDEVPEQFLGSDMLFMHPPYGAEIKIPYAGYMWDCESDELKLKDLGQMKWDEFMQTLNAIIMKYYVAMDTGARMSVLMGDVRRGGLHSMLTDVVKPGALEQVIIKMQHNTFSGRSGSFYGGHKGFVPLAHEYIMVLKKPGAYIIDFQVPRRVEMDIRDSKTATWRDVVYAVMKKHGEADLATIYGEIDGHERTKKNVHWREKVRQTLQMHPAAFVSRGNGVWAVAA